MRAMLPDECVLWQGRPAWRAVARDVLRIKWLASYFALMLIWQAASNRSEGLGPVDTLRAGVPLCLASLLLLGAAAGFAWAIARTTEYTITNQRCLLSFGVALNAKLSVPLRRLAAISVAAGPDGCGNIALRPKPGSRVSAIKLWPHVRYRRLGRSEVMLRAVPDALAMAALVSQAAAAVSPGALHALPVSGGRKPAGALAEVPAAGA